MKLLYEIEISTEGTFLERPNRFIGEVQLPGGQKVTAHVHDSGRLRELLFPGNKVFLRKAPEGSKRKTEWDIISALGDDGEEILINSAFHRYISEKILRDEEISPFGKIDSLKAEVKYGNSRLDYMLEKSNKKIWIEVKGVSLSIDGRASFPDSPSTRAQKHLKELMELKAKGERVAVMLLIFRKSDTFIPRWEIDPVFSELFCQAVDKGIEVYPIQISMEKGKIFYRDSEIKIIKK